MDCRAYCTATAYKIRPLFDHSRTRYKATLYRDVLHLEVPFNNTLGDVFLFSYGATVCWGLTKEKEEELLKWLRAYEENPLSEFEMDEFAYAYGETPKVIEDDITLPNTDVLTKLAFAHGIGQSVKLGTFEIAIQKTFNLTKHIPEELARKGRISLSKKEIRKRMGELFLERNSINLHFDVLDIPEFFWDYPELEPLYRLMANYLDIETRVEVLNHRLDVVHELFQMLGSELNHQHSSRLEWTIIWLIIIEVLLSLMRDVFRII
jgi:uncharacterized Rmd1/YagE family protein